MINLSWGRQGRTAPKIIAVPSRLALVAGALLLFALLFILPFSGATSAPLFQFLTPSPTPPPPPGAIQGTKFDDLNGNGVKDFGEPGVGGVFICLQGFSCIPTVDNGNYSFVNLTPGPYTVFESVPFGRINTTPISQTPLVASGLTTGGVNFGNRVISPPPPDVVIVSSGGTTTNSTPTQSRSTPLVIRKTITVCSPVNPPNVTLTWPFATPIIGSMANIGGNLWEVVFSPPFPGGAATMRIDIDCPPDTPGYPENPANISGEDAVQIGNIVFLDPSGTIKDACTGGPLVGATVTLLKESPPGSGNFFVPSNADHIPATNPQTTGADGKYAWVVVPGTYRVSAEKPPGFVTGLTSPVVIPPPVTGLDIALARVALCPPPNQPPNVSNAAASPANIWPPTNKFVPITVLGVTDPDGDPVSIVITSIAQDEPVGVGGFTPDGLGVGSNTAQVRAERAGTPTAPGNGRVYHIRFTASDGKGGSANGEVLVKVPHDQGKGTVVVDGGALYDSTIP